MTAMPGTRVFVTGASGMIGANLVHRLVAEACAVTVFVRPTSSLLRLAPVESRITISRGDLADADTVAAAIDRAAPDIVYHLASTPFNPPSIPTRDHLNLNVHGIANLLDALRSRPSAKFVFTGSANVYGEGERVPETHALEPGNMLGATKACATILMQTYSRLYQLPTVELRLYTPFGPWERPGRLLPHVILSALKGEDIRMTAGTQERDYLYIDDVVDAMLRAASHPLPPGTVLNICSGIGTPVRDIVVRMLALMGDPVRVQLGAVPTRPDEIWKFSGDNSLAMRMLDWSPKTSLEVGLKRMLDWYRAHQDIAWKLT
jgi:nucleoside-diphosphate-sugar epimerase